MRTVVGAFALVGLLALTGCIDSHPIPTLPPTPSATPIFASDEDALAAAEDAYRAYQEASTLIVNEGGVDPERIAPYVTEAHLEGELEGFGFYSDRGYRSEGAASFDSMSIQQLQQDANLTLVVVYLCVDVTNVRVFDQSDVDVTPASRPDRVPLEVSFEATRPGHLLVSESSQWSGTDFC
ncbi:hypothetical protein [Pseudolysinimonas sp.]|uniref:hypothetical protein n=1 Tax=Pseudolysinimonas sp. TaxID=2680009 RepID=UPI003266A430